MIQLGEAVEVSIITVDDIEGTNFLRFKLEDANGKPLAHIPYKTVITGSSPAPLHIEQGKTSYKGKTIIVSTTNDEEIDFHLSWEKLTVNKGFLKY